jgi:HSP20 family protein
MLTRTLLPTFDRLTWVDRELDRFLADAWSNGATKRPTPNQLWAPAIDVAEMPEAYLLAGELPGADPRSIDVSFDRGNLVVRGTKHPSFAKPETPENGAAPTQLLMSERVTGMFERTLQLPSDIDADGIEASFEHGVLLIRIPKADRARPRRITVKGVNEQKQLTP